MLLSLINQILQFQREARRQGWGKQPNAILSAVSAPHQGLLACMTQWHAAIEDLEGRVGGVSEGEVQDRVSVMRISYDIAMIGLKWCLRAAGDVDFRHLEAEFYPVFALARKCLEPNPHGMTAKVQRIIFGLDKETSNGKGSQNSGLSVHLGIIAPLIFVLKKCPVRN